MINLCIWQGLILKVHKEAIISIITNNITHQNIKLQVVTCGLSPTEGTWKIAHQSSRTCK